MPAGGSAFLPRRLGRGRNGRESEDVLRNPEDYLGKQANQDDTNHLHDSVQQVTESCGIPLSGVYFRKNLSFQ